MSKDKLDFIKAVLQGEKVDPALIGQLASELLGIVHEKIAQQDPNPELEKARKFTRLTTALGAIGLSAIAPAIAKRIMGDDDDIGGSMAKLPTKPRPPKSPNSPSGKPPGEEPKPWREGGSLFSRLFGRGMGAGGRGDR